MLPPVQIKVNLAPEDHALVSQLAALADKTIGEWCRLQIVGVLRAKVHAARLIVAAAESAGMDGKQRDPGPDEV